MLLFTGFGDNNITKFIDIYITVNTLILKLNYHENIVMLISYCGYKIRKFCPAQGLDVKLNTTCA